MDNTTKKNYLEKKLTGTAIPLGALKSKKSCGCGDFLDIIPFADFCKKAGLELIQLLPVNDTGTESSPYSALSAFALHPLYLRISALPECKSGSFKKQIELIKKNHENRARFLYRQLRLDKLQLLREIYTKDQESIIKNTELVQWMDENLWIKNYAVFMVLKDQYNEASWKEWPDFQNITIEDIEKRWKKSTLRKNHLFYAWLQMRCHEQFLQAAQYCKNQNILLKGDIPIMMNEDSADAWAQSDFFNTRLRAGSPPDASNPLGQNWGFPTYNWEALKKDSYLWWKERLKQAEKYYQVYRIDHVLGFFRIWSVSETERTAVNGWTEPCEPIRTEELQKLGFTSDKIRWLSRPHVPTRLIEEVNNGDYLGTHGYLAKIMNRIGSEELWLFNENIKGDKDIWAHEDLPYAVKKRLAELWRDRLLVETQDGMFFPQWTFQNSTAWLSLNYDEQKNLESLFNKKRSIMEKLWEDQARRLLGEICGSSSMLACAEDLGSNPDCVPSVLQDLSILGLRVVRWCRLWERPEQDFIPFEKYPTLSLTCTSVHDSSTLRLWWLKEKDAYSFFKTFPPCGTGSVKNQNADSIKPEQYTAQTAKYLLKTIAASNSLYCVHPLQDFLSLSPQSTDPDPENERINIPGTVNEHNWTYRIPFAAEDLINDKTLCTAIAEIAKIHQNTLACYR